MCYLLNQIHVRLCATTCALQIHCTRDSGCYCCFEKCQHKFTEITVRDSHLFTHFMMACNKSVVWMLARKDPEKKRNSVVYY